MSFMIDGWHVNRDDNGNWVALLLNENDEIKTFLVAESLNHLIIKVDQANHPERCSE